MATKRKTESKHMPTGLMRKWIDESFRLVAPKQLVESLPARKRVKP